MKLKNILSILCVFFAAVSCSMEDDILNEVGATNPIDEEVSGEAYIAIKTFLASGANTKSIEEGGTIDANGEEAAINSCSLILFNGNTVQAVADGVYVGEDNVIVKNASPEAAGDTVKFMVKVNQADYSLMVVANSTTEFAGCATLSDVESQIQSNNVSSLVKVGTSKITFPADFEGYTSTIESASKPLMTEVVLTQLTARVELKGFNVEFINETRPVNITIKEIKVQNINNRSNIGSTAINEADGFSSLSQSYTDGITVYSTSSGVGAGTYVFGDEGNEPAYPFYTYRNANNTNPLEMAVTYLADGVEKTTRWIKINGDNAIQNGTIYQLTINAKVTSDEFDCDVQFSTKPWMKHSMSVGMEEKTN